MTVRRNSQYLENSAAVLARCLALFCGGDDAPDFGTVGAVLRDRVHLIAAAVVPPAESDDAEAKLTLFMRVDDTLDVLAYCDPIGGAMLTDRPMSHEELDRVLFETVFGLWEELASGSLASSSSTSIRWIDGFDTPFSSS